MAPRLPIDPFVLCYFGFDEANETDPALDESSYGNPLAVVGSPAVVAARIGNGRQFDGAATYASPADSSRMRDFNPNGTIILWATLDDVLQTGDKLRPLLTLEGPGAGPEDATVFALYVQNDGAVVFRYDTPDPRAGYVNPLPVLCATAPGTFKVTRFYSVALVCDADEDGNRVARLFLNNVEIPWVSVTVNGESQPDATRGPPPAASGNNTTLRVGAASKSTSKWHGVIDELSVHSIARSVNPYLRAAYFRLTLDATFQRLTAHGNVRTIGTVEMGGGTRWWCYERDQNLYVIRENSLGLFQPEVLLTTSGLDGRSVLQPGGVEQPRLAYDPASDTLLVVFLSAGKVYKVTATSSDLPATQNMPTTADTAGIIKMRDQVEQFRASVGTPGADPRPSDGFGIGSTFLTTPSFGIAIETGLGYGFVVFRGPLGAPREYVRTPLPVGQTVRPYAGFYYWVPVPDRVYGLHYWVAALDREGEVRWTTLSWVGQDFFGRIYEKPGAFRYDWDQTQEEAKPGIGGPVQAGPFGRASYPPFKFWLADSMSVTASGESPLGPRISKVNFDPLKFPSADSVSVSMVGGDGFAALTAPGGRVVRSV